MRYRSDMLGLTPLDAFAFAWFVMAWAGYSWLVDVLGAKRGLTSTMAVYRERWMHEMLHRSNRIVDGQINMTLQQGTAFFASTSLLAVGGGLTLIGATDRAVEFVQTLPFGYHPSREQWEVKVAGLTIIFVYAFFKFAWAYRLFNYCAILIGATPDGDRRGTEEAVAMAGRAAKMNAIAAAHFNRGQRAFFFALGYLGWFAGPIVLVVTTAAVVSVIYRRQFCSNSLDAVRL
ncbi:DUF599 domain-containing protein [Phreatobacter stygius]|nr:DUF599 family protein [Phreatobacter stygius]